MPGPPPPSPPDEPSPDDDLALALALAERADAVTMRHFRTPELVIERKPDRTEVTVADRGAEAAIEEALFAARNGDALLGEEFGVRGAPDAARRWIVDPIDGTSNYVRGVPIWATLIALEVGGRIEVGVVSAPALHRRWWAARGRGAHLNGMQIRVSGIDRLGDAFLSWSEGPWGDKGRRSGIQALHAAAGRTRCFGDFWQHMLVAEGAIDVAAEPIVSLWDLAALQVIVEEAGGRFTDLDGHARPDGGSAVSTNGHLHDAVLATLAAGTAERD